MKLKLRPRFRYTTNRSRIVVREYRGCVGDVRHVILPCMSDQGSDDDQADRRFDALVKRLLTTPPKSRAELAEEVRRAKREKPIRNAREAHSAGKREGAA